MVVAGTEKTITVDANVIHYYHLCRNKKTIPKKFKRIKDFCEIVMENHSIAMNEFIRAEYRELDGWDVTKHFLIIRREKGLVKDVEYIDFSKKIENFLRDYYGFDCHKGHTAKDAKYIKTCFNTDFKHLITENIKDFKRSHKTPKHQPMHNYLKKELSITIYQIDECCESFLNNRC